MDGYGYVYQKGSTTLDGSYWIEKTRDGYIFVSEVGGVYSFVNSVKANYTFYIDSTVMVTEDGKEYSLSTYLDKNSDLSKYLAIVDFDNDTKDFSIYVDKRYKF